MATIAFYTSEHIKDHIVASVQYKGRTDAKVTPFKPCAGIKDRLSMNTINPYRYDARPPPSLDFTLLP